jgi:hypothetical protein
MLMTFQVSADTADNARDQAVRQAKAQGYSRVSGVRVVGNVGRTYTVQLDGV